MKVNSPLTNSENTVLEKNIFTKDIIKGYKDEFKTDVTNYFSGIETISVYKCLDTGFKFFYPFTIAGDGKFYESLQQFDWYYMDWKWEHEIAGQYIVSGNKVLEIGCARGAFIEKLSKSGFDCVGLELNEDAVVMGKKKGIRILNETIQEHALANKENYDIVCSFQVMEHIVAIHEVLQASIATLKKGGTLIISVPNNDSFLGLSVNYLNMPPHHMGLWSEKVFQSIAKIFNLKLVKVHFEPLQEYHKEYFANTMTAYYLEKYRSLAFIANKIIPKLIPKITGLFSVNTKAFTVQGVFEKL
jgi:2-polyprenyl-3-methyl-5-hydroxy-6-metoxy-1,4-benzoquinol methylase